MLRTALAALLVLYLPGAVLFRLPFANRPLRARLDVEERWFWYLMISLGWSLGLTLALAAAGWYRLDLLLEINGASCLVAALAWRSKLRLRAESTRITWTVVPVLVLVALGAWRFFPPAEYILGGRDPGSYINSGVQIAQRGSLDIREPVVADVPAAQRDLFFPQHHNHPYYGVRFMGFFVLAPDTGRSIGQFPHLYPASIALGYDMGGVPGARAAVSVFALIGVLAVYFLGARLIGRAAGFAAAALLSLNLIEVWFAHYPNSEMVMQALLFAALLAFARAHQDADGFFAPVAAVLASLLIFDRADALLVVAVLATAALLAWLCDGRPLRVAFLLPLAIGTTLGLVYLTGTMSAYFEIYSQKLAFTPIWIKVTGLVTVIAAVAVLRLIGPRLRNAIPIVLALGTVGLAIYAYFFRYAHGKLAAHDAAALRTFADLYVSPAAVAAALIGLLLIVRRKFWNDPAFFLTLIGFSLFLFYKLYIWPEHFWMTRRFVPVILPGTLLLVAAAALAPMAASRARRTVRVLIGLVFVAVLARQYVLAAEPVRSHVEYSGVTARLERLAARFTDRDLVIVESRNSDADLFALAVPLAYIYRRNVLVLDSARPDAQLFQAFLADAQKRYDRVFFMVSNGTDLLSRQVAATPVGGDTIQLHEYERTTGITLPSGARRKDFAYSIYQLSLGACDPNRKFKLDVGFEDELYVVRFNAKEKSQENNDPRSLRTIRWTGLTSTVAVPCMSGAEREVLLTMHDGGRPSVAGTARVDVFFNDLPIGSVDVGSGFKTYQLALPADAVRAAALIDAPARLVLKTNVWNPQALRGGNDNRNLGVMLDQVEIR